MQPVKLETIKAIWWGNCFLKETLDNSIVVHYDLELQKNPPNSFYEKPIAQHNPILAIGNWHKNTNGGFRELLNVFSIQNNKLLGSTIFIARTEDMALNTYRCATHCSMLAFLFVRFW